MGKRILVDYQNEERKSIDCFEMKKKLVACFRGVNMSNISQIIGERIRMYRTRKKISQDTLGEMAGLHGKYIGQLERGEKNATLESVEKVARALDLPFEVLFENIIVGGTQNEIPKQCYDLLTPLSLREQKAMLALIEKTMEFRNA